MKRPEEVLKQDFEQPRRRDNGEWTVVDVGIAKAYVQELERVITEMRSHV